MEEKLYTPKQATEILGIHIRTLQNWDLEGKIKVIRTPSNRRRIPQSEIDRLLQKETVQTKHVNENSPKRLVIYGRVSSHEQKSKGDLERQIGHILCSDRVKKFRYINTITDVGSGLNDKRKGLLKLMNMAKNNEMDIVAISYKDRLTRFGFNYLEVYFNSYSVEVLVVNDTVEDKSPQQELVEDLMSIIASFSGKLYGLRSGKNKVVEDKVKEFYLMHYTYQTKIYQSNIMPPTKEVYYLQKYGELFSMIEHKMYVDLVFRRKTKKDLKAPYCREFDITSRQFNSIYSQIDGKISAINELKKKESIVLLEKISKIQGILENLEVEKKIMCKKLLLIGEKHKDFEKIVKRYRKLKYSIHQKKRRLQLLLFKYGKVNEDINNKIVRLCFGSKNLFRKQFNLKENGFKSHEDWKVVWRNKRSSQFTCLGSKDESFGNQNCQYDLNNNFVLRTTHGLEDEFGQYITFKNINFQYGQQNIDKCKETYNGFTKSGKSQRYFKGAMTHRFCRNEYGWYIYSTVEVDDSPVVTSINRGAKGIDFNVNFLSVCTIDRFGNPLREETFKYEMYSKNTKQIETMLKQQVSKVVKQAKLEKMDICIEDLSLEKKKLFFDKDKKYARMLSSFPYKKFMEYMDLKCKKEGVNLRIVNPAYTSIIGQFKYMKRYGLSSHGSAACVIARRGMGYKDKCNKSEFILKHNKRFNLNQPTMKKWAEVSKIAKKKFGFNNRITMLYKEAI